MLDVSDTLSCCHVEHVLEANVEGGLMTRDILLTGVQGEIREDGIARL